MHAHKYTHTYTHTHIYPFFPSLVSFSSPSNLSSPLPPPPFHFVWRIKFLFPNWSYSCSNPSQMILLKNRVRVQISKSGSNLKFVLFFSVKNVTYYPMKWFRDLSLVGHGGLPPWEHTHLQIRDFPSSSLLYGYVLDEEDGDTPKPGFDFCPLFILQKDLGCWASCPNFCAFWLFTATPYLRLKMKIAVTSEAEISGPGYQTGYSVKDLFLPHWRSWSPI